MPHTIAVECDENVFTALAIELGAITGKESCT